jgi:hypothetical protein
MKIRVVKAFNGYRVGQVFDWGDGMARIFIARGMIEPVGEKTAETAMLDILAKKPLSFSENACGGFCLSPAVPPPSEFVSSVFLATSGGFLSVSIKPPN